ncbi:alpha-taxilin [Parasteatoda tepidariorum]|uniref:alpha-taxilin n=1 Tax=Parasteatoda tepidariorum TaxID=114398 RepID=UPI001C7288EA|nr:alpha-taxilin [Parasteatoda tepidariorum]
MNTVENTMEGCNKSSDASVNTANTQSNLNECPVIEDDLTDDYNDIDLSDIIPSALDPTLTMDNSVSLVSGNDSYKEIINVCSSTAQVLKKTISDVLNSRGNVVITEVDDSSELEATLNQKIADFNNTVDGCLKNQNQLSASNNADNNSDLPANVLKDTEENRCDICLPESLQGSCEEICNSDASSENSYNNNVDTEQDTNAGTSETKSFLDAQNSSQVQKGKPATKENESKTVVSSEDSKIAKKSKSVISKKKGEKTVDQILKSLSGYSSTEEKLQQLCKKHLETLEDLRLFEPRLKQLEKQVVSQQREKESLQAELNRMILAKSRLESLCREMQRQSKAVKEESLIRIKEEEEKRKEVANKFQTTLNDISTLMQENSKRNTALREENAELSQKLKMLMDNYSVWEENMKKIVQHKELEAQLANAKCAKVNLELKQETEKFLREKQTLLENMSELQKKCTLLTANELQLRTELGDYTNKYEEFQSVLTNSSKVFATFKSDMDATSKKIKKLEKETNVYKQKWESSNKALLDMISHKEKQDRENANAQQRILTLEKLCRALQAERNDLRNELNALTATGDCQNEQNVPLPSTESLDVATSSS